jgi:ferric iron reductase protein FhuF
VSEIAEWVLAQMHEPCEFCGLHHITPEDERQCEELMEEMFNKKLAKVIEELNR